MIDALVIVDDNSSPRGVAAALPYICSALVIPISAFSPELAQDARMLVFDLNLGVRDNVLFLRSVFSGLPDKPKIVFTSRSDRHEVVQACAVGGATILGRADSKNMLNLTVRQVFRNLGEDFTEGGSESTATAARQAANLYTDITQAVLNEEPLPRTAAANSAVSIVDAVRGDGIDSWLGLVQRHHSHTYCHSMMVSGYAAAFGDALDLDDETVRILTLGGLLHDIGKVRIPLAILDKPGKLDDAEMALIRKHPEHGLEILSAQKGIDARIIEITHNHHEMLDGSGYPRGLRDDEISPLVRMLTICDIFAALTEERPYKEHYSRRVAYSILLDMGGKLDKALLKLFRPVAFQSEFGELKRSNPRSRATSNAEQVARLISTS
ncbi:HD domain-containing protein [Stappia sp. F7233]|uniref:HD domain-containing protein n=1 Tax=Stappia albiluteola TaxID=2758565 RepID=A0A839AC74_9HYPH|nr:HD domain-containing phosphohydrolase [Stappia albiluteola]MBA5777243.1 HD domain-containing protein [Stappia albiluteola]